MESDPATSDATRQIDTEWLTLAELTQILGEPLGRVRRRLDEFQLVGSRRHGAFTVPAVFLQNDEPIGSLRGTLFVLHDAGFTDDEAIDWLLASEESIGVPPIEALRTGRKSEVRRVAQSLG